MRGNTYTPCPPPEGMLPGGQAALAVPLWLVGARRERALLELGLGEEADLVVRVCGLGVGLGFGRSRPGGEGVGVRVRVRARKKQTWW